TEGIFERAQIDCRCFAGLPALCAELDRGAGAVLVPEEILAGDEANRLILRIAQQPPWSDLPVLVVARLGADSAAVARAMDLLGNVTVLERPTRVAALVSAARTALRARHRQYQIREHLADLVLPVSRAQGSTRSASTSPRARAPRPSCARTTAARTSSWRSWRTSCATRSRPSAIRSTSCA